MTADLDTCRWCGGPHPIEFCGEVLAACGVGPAWRDRREAVQARPTMAACRKPGRPHSGMGDSNKRAVHDSYPCVVAGCEAPRATGRPRCQRHEAEAQRARRGKWAARQGY